MFLFNPNIGMYFKIVSRTNNKLNRQQLSSNSANGQL